MGESTYLKSPSPSPSPLQIRLQATNPLFLSSKGNRSTYLCVRSTRCAGGSGLSCCVSLRSARHLVIFFSLCAHTADLSSASAQCPFLYLTSCPAGACLKEVSVEVEEERKSPIESRRRSVLARVFKERRRHRRHNAACGLDWVLFGTGVPAQPRSHSSCHLRQWSYFLVWLRVLLGLAEGAVCR
jgi:hypothetical protein